MNKEIVDAICRQFTDHGKLIEAGFAGFQYGVMAPDATPDQVLEMRMAFFAGAQHLFASIMGILEPGAEPTANDLKRITLIHDELDTFIKRLKAAHGYPGGR